MKTTLSVILMFGSLILGSNRCQCAVPYKELSPAEQKQIEPFGPVFTKDSKGNTIEFHFRSLSGGVPENVEEKTETYLSLQKGYLHVPERKVSEAVSKVFPIGMKRDALIGPLRKIRREHLFDTELTDYAPTVDKNGVQSPGNVLFAVKSFSRMYKTENGKTTEVEDEIAVDTFQLYFLFSNTDEISGYLTGIVQDTY